MNTIYEKYTDLLRENGILKNEVAEMQKNSSYFTSSSQRTQ